VEEGTSSSWDGIGLLLCAHIILRLQMVTHKRAVPALDHFFSAALDYIWPAFDRALSANANSLKNCDTLPTDLMPHYVCNLIKWLGFKNKIHFSLDHSPLL
jgi:hypothetical protein